MEDASEADALSDWEGDDFYGADSIEEYYELAAWIPRSAQPAPKRPTKRTSARRASADTNAGRWRCLHAGCNPRLTESSAVAHRGTTGHRVAAWPVRSVEGTRKQTERGRSGYYDKYNVGTKSARSRLATPR